MSHGATVKMRGWIVYRVPIQSWEYLSAPGCPPSQAVWEAEPPERSLGWKEWLYGCAGTVIPCAIESFGRFNPNKPTIRCLDASPHWSGQVARSSCSRRPQTLWFEPRTLRLVAQHPKAAVTTSLLSRCMDLHFKWEVTTVPTHCGHWIRNVSTHKAYRR